MRRPLVLLPSLLVALTGTHALAQDDAVPQVAEPPPAELDTVLDEAPFATPRASGMAGAIGNVADDLDAAMHNPAGIGGYGWSKSKPPLIRKLYFPWVTVGGNPDSKELSREMRQVAAETGNPSTTSEEGSQIGKALAEAQTGKRQYVRATFIPTALVLGRTMVVPFTDQQVTAVSRAEGAQTVDLRLRNMSGLGFGFSASGSDDDFSIGYFGYYASRSETKGSFTFDEINNADLRKAKISDSTTNATGISHGIGTRFKLGKTWSPTLSLAMKDVGGTKWSASKGEDFETKQDASVGFGLSPTIGRWGTVNFVVEGFRLLDPDVTLEKKLRTGVELTMFGLGSYATVGVRAGYGHAGGAAGLSLNLGLIGMEVATEAVDVGAGNRFAPERRYLGTVYVNVAEF